MDAPIDQLKQLAATADDVTRQQLVKSLNELVLSLESPNDTVHRYGHMVSCLFAFVELVQRVDCCPSQNLQTATIRIGFDLGLFKLLSEAGGPITVEEVAQKTQSERVLIRTSSFPRLTGPLLNFTRLDRILRYLEAIGAVTETSATQYSANNVTRNLTEKAVEAGLGH